MKISEFLQKEGVFSNEIKARIRTGQMKINGEKITDDIELNNIESFEAGDWIFKNLLSVLSEDKKNIFLLITTLFDIETLFSGDCQINNKPIEEILPELNILKSHVFLKTSKKQMFILKLL
jgi:hypothetical protein